MAKTPFSPGAALMGVVCGATALLGELSSAQTWVDGSPVHPDRPPMRAERQHSHLIPASPSWGGEQEAEISLALSPGPRDHHTQSPLFTNEETEDTRLGWDLPRSHPSPTHSDKP